MNCSGIMVSGIMVGRELEHFNYLEQSIRLDGSSGGLEPKSLLSKYVLFSVGSRFLNRRMRRGISDR